VGYNHPDVNVRGPEWNILSYKVRSYGAGKSILKLQFEITRGLHNRKSIDTIGGITICLINPIRDRGREVLGFAPHVPLPFLAFQQITYIIFESLYNIPNI